MRKPRPLRYTRNMHLLLDDRLHEALERARAAKHFDNLTTTARALLSERLEELGLLAPAGHRSRAHSR